MKERTSITRRHPQQDHLLAVAMVAKVERVRLYRLRVHRRAAARWWLTASWRRQSSHAAHWASCAGFMLRLQRAWRVCPPPLYSKYSHCPLARMNISLSRFRGSVANSFAIDPLLFSSLLFLLHCSQRASQQVVHPSAQRFVDKPSISSHQAALPPTTSTDLSTVRQQAAASRGGCASSPRWYTIITRADSGD